jgi:hypothetical protein
MSQMAGGAPSLPYPKASATKYSKYGRVSQGSGVSQSLVLFVTTRLLCAAHTSVCTNMCILFPTRTTAASLPHRPNKQHTICWGAPPQQPLKAVQSIWGCCITHALTCKHGCCRHRRVCQRGHGGFARAGLQTSLRSCSSRSRRAISTSDCLGFFRLP